MRSKESSSRESELVSDPVSSASRGKDVCPANWIDTSPRQVAQRKKLAGLFGSAIQFQQMDEDEPLQGKFSSQSSEFQNPSDRRPTALVENNTGMPDQLKANLEAMSGFDLSAVRVHRNSDKPAQLLNLR